MVSYTNSLGIELQVTGTNSGTWGTKTNNNFELFEQAIAGYQDVSIAGAAQTTALLMSDATISNARNAVIKLSGTITGNQIVTVPDGIEKVYIISNETSGSFTVEFKTASGTGYTFGTGDKTKRVLYSDGTNIVDTGIITTASTDTLSNKTFSGTITNSGTIAGGTVSAVTLTKPRFADTGFIADSNGNEQIIFQETASAVNEFEITNAATGNNPGLAATGGDSNVGIDFTAKGNGKFVFNDAAYFPEATLTDGATINWDVQAEPVAKVTLGGDRTLAAPTNGSTGQFVSLLIIQDSTGTRLVTFNAAYEFTGDTAPTLTTTASKGDLFVFYYNGTKYLEVGRNLNLTLS